MEVQILGICWTQKASLEADLGDFNLMSPFSNQSSPQHPKQRRRNSSYYRRQQRRRNSRISQTGSAEEAVVNAADSTSPDQITENPKNVNENIDAKTVEVSATTSHSADPSHIVTLDSSTSSSPLMASDTSDEFSNSGLEFGFGISNLVKSLPPQTNSMLQPTAFDSESTDVLLPISNSNQPQPKDHTVSNNVAELLHKEVTRRFMEHFSSSLQKKLSELNGSNLRDRS